MKKKSYYYLPHWSSSISINWSCRFSNYYLFGWASVIIISLAEAQASATFKTTYELICLRASSWKNQVCVYLSFLPFLELHKLLLSITSESVIAASSPGDQSSQALASVFRSHDHGPPIDCYADLQMLYCHIFQSNPRNLWASFCHSRIWNI